MIKLLVLLLAVLVISTVHGQRSRNSEAESSSSSSEEYVHSLGQPSKNKAKSGPQRALSNLALRRQPLPPVENAKRPPELRSLEQAQAFGVLDAIKAGENLSIPEKHKKQRLHVNRVALPLSRASASSLNWDPAYFEMKGIRFWIQKTFLQLYEKYTVPFTTQEINDAVATFKKFEYKDFQSKSRIGTIMDLEVVKLKSIVDIWKNDDLITGPEAEQLKLTLDAGTTQQEAKDVAHTRGNGDIVYGKVAFISLKASATEIPTGTIVYSFRLFHFSLPMDVTYRTTTSCVLWGLFCKSVVTAQTSDHKLTGKESTDLGNYVVYDTIKDYNVENGPFIKYLVDETARYRSFVPKQFQDIWDDIESHPQKDPQTIAPFNVMDPSQYKL